MTTNFFTRVSVSGASFSSTPDVNLSGNTSFSLINEGTGTIEYSFDGSTLHGDLVATTPSAAMTFTDRGFSLIWFRLKSGATSSIRVEGAPGSIEVGSSGSSGGGGSSTITGPLGSQTKAASVAVTLSTNEPALPVINTGGAKGATAAATVTSTANGADHQGLDSVEQYAPVYEDNASGRALVEQRNSYTNITSATTTTVKSGAGFLHLIMINAAVASATITIYDNTSAAGTKIATITMPATLLSSQIVLRFDVSFSTGLTIVTTGAEDLTVSWR